MLYIVSTPIGNLGDITSRAVVILRSVDRIAAEDTRRTRRLLSSLQIGTPLVSYHDFNKQKRAPRIIEQLLSGESLALVSDAGTPGISDPGYLLIRMAIEHSIPVIPVPGPSSVLAALSVSGLPTDRFVFEGFLDARGGRRRRELEGLRDEERTIVLFESPYRIASTMEDIVNVLGNRQICMAREMTKVHEEVIRGDAETVLSLLKGRERIRGEITLIIQGKGKREKVDPQDTVKGDG